MIDKHTKGPWSQDKQFVIADDSSLVIGCCWQGHDGTEDARRIVACANACEDIDTETLEATVGLDALYSEMMRQRDTLLSALKELGEAYAKAIQTDSTVTVDFDAQCDTIEELAKQDEHLAKALLVIATRGVVA